ncbi:MAG: protein kinase [Deltaproteobacteria bacterium]|nr:protein kinase [Deltaproteobacteria bacterium]
MSALADTPQLPARYRIEKRLGSGAMGDVFLAADMEAKRRVAIKVLNNAAIIFSNDAGAADRFHNEFNSLKLCQHPNIIRVYDYCEYKRTVFFTMEYVEGSALSSFIPQKPEIPAEDIATSDGPIDVMRSAASGAQASAEKPIPLTVEQAIDYLFQIAQGLAVVHDRGMIHRDLKPDNVFITKDNRVKLLDFGFAKLEQSSLKLTAANNVLGTPNYMAPETLGSDGLDHCADIYSFGVLAFELLTSELPYKAETKHRLSFKHALAKIPSAKAINPQIPDWLEALIKTCMEKDKKHRYQSMLEIIVVISKNSPHLTPDQNLINKLSKAETDKALNRHSENIKRQKHTEAGNSLKRILTVFCLSMFFTLLWLTPVGAYSNIFLLRTLFAIRGPIDPPKDVVIVALDDLTYQHFGVSTRKPFPRKYWAQALEKIHATKPKVVIIDGYIQKEDDDEEGNAALERAIGSGPTVLMKWEEENKALPKENRNDSNKIQHHNDPRFSKSALMEIAPFFSYEGKNVVARFGNPHKELVSPSQLIPLRAVMERVGLQALAKPEARDYISFYGKANILSTVSMFDVISGSYDFNNKIVIIGSKSLTRSNSTILYDLFETTGSFSEKYFGIEIHATIAENLIDNSYIRSLLFRVEGVIISLSLAFIIISLLGKKPALVLRSLFVIFAIWFGATLLAFIYMQILIPGVYFMLFVSFIVCALSWYVYGNKREANLVQIEKITGIEVRNPNS